MVIMIVLGVIFYGVNSTVTEAANTVQCSQLAKRARLSGDVRQGFFAAARKSVVGT